ncbi:MAG: hypothetical protein CMA77_01980, partial [Euryarchaeota archaeon]|nr:hypothetical protein [Euryarchaeota archaeon]
MMLKLIKLNKLMMLLFSIVFAREVEQIGAFSGNIQNVVIQQKYAYLYDSLEGIIIIDIGNPILPVEVGTINLGRDTRNLIIDGNNLFSVDGSDGLTVIDVTDKTNPTEIEHYTDGTTFYDLKTKGSYVYALTGLGISGSLKILDFTNPSAISEVSQLLLTGTSLGTSLDITENLVVITDYFNIHTVDVSDVDAPILKSSLTSTGTNHIRLKGELGFVSRSESGLDIYNFNNPEIPELINEYD